MSDQSSNPSNPAPVPESEHVAPDGVELAAEGGIESEDGHNGGIESPAKIIRIGAMVKQLLEEVRNTSLDDAARERLKDIYGNSLAELQDALSPELGEELDRLSLDFSTDAVPSDAELRVAQAQLVGWLEGLFHGIQATLVAQQMAAQQQLQGMRGQLPERASGPAGGPGYI